MANPNSEYKTDALFVPRVATAVDPTGPEMLSVPGPRNISFQRKAVVPIEYELFVVGITFPLTEIVEEFET